MKIANDFTVSAPIEEAWNPLVDLEQVIPLMPGAQMTGQDCDYVLGKVKVKIGPVTSEFNGKVRFVEQDTTSGGQSSTPTARRSAEPATPRPTVTMTLHEAGDRTRVTVDTDLKIVGKLAQFGSGLLQQVSEKPLGQFAESREAKLVGADEPAAPAAALALSLDASPAGAPADKPKTVSAVASPEPAPIDLLELTGGTALKEYVPLVLGTFATAAALFALGRVVVTKLRTAGVTVSAGGAASFVAAMGVLAPRSRSEVYWAARLTLVNRVEDLSTFDAVISAVFDDAVSVPDVLPSRLVARADEAFENFDDGDLSLIGDWLEQAAARWPRRRRWGTRRADAGRESTCATPCGHRVRRGGRRWA